MSPNWAEFSRPKRQLETGWGRADWWMLVGLTLLALAAFSPFLGSCGIIDSSEGYYAESAREMVERGDFITPYLNYRLWLEKPILIYWLIASSYKLFGVSEFSARLPGALCAVLTILFTYVFARQFVSRRTALLSAFALTTCPLFAVIGHLCLTDMPLTLFTTVAAGSLFVALRGGGVAWMLAGYVALGLAVLTKGPVGAVFAGIPLAAYLILRARSIPGLMKNIWKLNPIFGVLLVAVIALPWYLAIHATTDGQFFQVFFVHHNMDRLTGHIEHRNPIWFYIPFLLGGFMPWTLVMMAAPKQLVRMAHRFRLSLTPRESLFLFASLWAVLLVGLLSLIPTKLGTYILPAFPALAILAGLSTDILLRLNKSRNMIWTAVLMVLVGVVATALLPLFTKPPSLFFYIMLTGGVVTTAALVSYLVLLLKNKTRLAVGALCAAAFIGCTTLVPAGIMAFYERYQLDCRLMIEHVKNMPGLVAVFGTDRHSAEFYLKRRVPIVHDVHRLVEVLGFSAAKKGEPEVADWLIVRDQNRVDIVKRLRPNSTIAAHQGRWFLLKVER